MMRNFIIATALLCAAFSSQATAQSDHAAHIAAQIALAGRVYEQAGYQRTHNFSVDQLRNGQSEDFSVRLQSGWSYIIVGACDRDCTDLDLTLFDDNGNEIAKDTQTDALPIVQATPRWSAPFTLRVRMYECSVNPCAYALAIYGR